MNELQLTTESLSNPTLLALAWKKAHQYIRTTNWYADNFELDKSTVNLSSLCNQWAAEIKERNLKFTPLELVPAPKSQKWEFAESSENSNFCLDWTPKVNISEGKSSCTVKLRPLAHIGIKEQTIMTMVMMFLANHVETEQGDPSTEYNSVHNKKIVSYGNRIYCKYQNGSAEHNYGATHIYSKFFKDYQTFLQRPYHFANEELTEKGTDEEVYLIELDLKQFFDKVNRAELIKKTLAIIERLEGTVSKSRSLKHILNLFEQWKWSTYSSKDSVICNGEDFLPKGIPQGLVAGGFFANIYLLDFDKTMADAIGTSIDGSGIKLIDYCRYVDDMRLVLIAPSRSRENPKPIEKIKEFLNDFFKEKLAHLYLEINQDKTKVEIYRGRSVGVSKQLQDIQTKVSGPVSFEEAHEQLTQLESLLSVCSESNPDQDNPDCFPNHLASIERNVFDVRDDTLRRFATNKISKMLSSVRHFTARETDEFNSPIAGDWDSLQERMARRLIAVWSRDPSLVLLLKKGLELFPSPKLLRPVLDQFNAVLERKCDSEQKERLLNIRKEKAVIHYLLSEVFRHSAVVIHRKDPQAIPAQADVSAYFELLQHRAAEILYDQTSEKPQLLITQARFLLLVRLDTILGKSSGNSNQDLIFKLATGFRNISLQDEMGLRFDEQTIATGILLASQLLEDQTPLIRSANAILDQELLQAHSILQIIAIQDTNLVRRLVHSARHLKLNWLRNGDIEELITNLYINIKPSRKALADIKQEIGIYQLICREDNPFSNEIMAIKLMKSLLDKSEYIKPELENVIDLARTKIKFEQGYSNPPKFKDFDQELKIVGKVKMHKPAFQFADHLTDKPEESKILQRVALAVRAGLAGTPDVTGFGKSIEPKVGYRGLKSTQYKRQIGLYTTPESLAGETASFTTWLTTLLSKLLIWPGIHINDQGYRWPELTIENVKKLLTDRLEELKTNYCQLSEIPAISELIRPDWIDSKSSLTVAMVQSKLPHKKDLDQDIYLSSPSYRTKHRRHVAKVSELVIKHIQAQQLDMPQKASNNHQIDIIIWPELAVNQDDMDILIQLSRKTHAIILAGLSFVHQHGIKGPNNRAVWIVPRKHNGNQNEILRYQGKFHMMKDEVNAGIQPWRPYQLMLELRHPKFPNEKGFMLTGSICYDATDIKLSADLINKSNAYLIPALNRDVNTFDNMVEALHYHMYQHVVLVNTGEFGGSYAMAPYKESYDRLIAHATGNDQVAINTFDMNMFDFRSDGVGKSFRSKDKKEKVAPAGISKGF